MGQSGQVLTLARFLFRDSSRLDGERRRLRSFRFDRVEKGAAAARVMPERYAGAIIVGLDVHLRQITFDCLDSATGEVTRGRITPTPAAVQERVAQFPGREVHVAMEACTGWLHQLERFDSHDLRGSAGAVCGMPGYVGANRRDRS
jgi:hypothetical protein